MFDIGETTMKNSTLICIGSMLAIAVSVYATEEEKLEEFDWSIGADFRVRQEIMDNIPGHPGNPGSAFPAASGKNNNWFRFRPRVWTELGNDDFGLYFRIADEMREHVTKNGKRRDNRSYNFPDEVIVDNLYFEFKSLFDDRLRLRIGRQDFIDRGRPAFGSGRLLMDGTAYDGSRSAYFDAVRATLKLGEKATLDGLAIYNAGENHLRWGRPTPHPRAINAIDPRDSADMDEYGGGLYFKSQQLGDDLPFELYYLAKRETNYRLLGVKKPGRLVHTWGARFAPRFSETLSAEFEAAVQSGEKDSGATTSGMMGYAGLTYRPALDMPRGLSPYVRASCYYLYGDDGENGRDNRDTGWDPLWSRWPQDSEMLVYGPLYGLGYWSNLIYPAVTIGVDSKVRHRFKCYAGPMFCAEDDGYGGGDSSYQGMLAVARYDFPLRTAGKNERFDISGHVMGEVLQPGDYYITDKTAYFVRWEIVVRF
jgi:hypothetical protein